MPSGCLLIDVLQHGRPGADPGHTADIIIFLNWLGSTSVSPPRRARGAGWGRVSSGSLYLDCISANQDEQQQIDGWSFTDTHEIAYRA